MSVGLTDQPWMTAPPTVAVLDALEAAGGPDCARFVGGCVRNALLGQLVDDIDIATTLEPASVIAALDAAGLKHAPTGLAHGTVTAVAERRPFEITTLRHDVSTDGRNATVAFTADWGEDAARRDFRLNALYADRQGRVFDPTGHGVEDGLNGRIVFVGEPEVRIREDYLRILRFFRFFAWYGRGEPDAAGLEACRALAPGMTRLSAERISRELIKLLAAPDPVPAVGAMEAAGVLGQILPESPGGDALTGLAAVSDDPELRLSALLPDDPAVVAQALARLRFPNSTRDRLTAAAGPIDIGMDDRAGRAAIYRLGPQAFRDRIVKAAGGHAAHLADADRLLALADAWSPPRLPVGGRELQALGVTPGPEHGRILKAFEAGWIADDFPMAGHEARLQALIAPG